MRPVQFDDETVIQAAKDLEAAGRSVTGFAIRQKVGGGNPTRLKQVWDEHIKGASSEVVAPVNDLPSELAEELEMFNLENTKRLNAIAAELNNKAIKSAQHMVNDILKTSAEQRQHADRELQDAADTVEDLERKLNAADVKIVSMGMDLESLQATVQANAVEIGRLNERLVASAQVAKDFTEFKRSTAAAAEVHQITMTAVEADLAKVRGEREALVKDLASAQAKSAADHQASVESTKRTERVEAELAKVRGEREALVKELANAQAKAAGTDEQLKKAAKEASVHVAERDEARKQASTAREEAAKLAGKVEALEQQVDNLAVKKSSK